MSILERLKNWAWGRQEQQFTSLELKKAFDVVKTGIAGKPAAPAKDLEALLKWQTKNELVYACIEKICQAACDPEITVERKTKKGEWEKIEGHPLVALFNKPNPVDTGEDLRRAIFISEHLTGEFYAEIVKSRTGEPVELYPLNPQFINPVPSGRGRQFEGFEFNNGTDKVRLSPEEVLYRRRYDLTNIYHGLAPLVVAVGAADADSMLTDYVRAFFQNDGTPSGILRFKDRNMTVEQMEAAKLKWKANMGRGGRDYRGISVLDQNAEYEKIGSNIAELESETLRSQTEARICMVFGVPPILVGAYVGLLHSTTNATARVHLEDFWLNKMSPELKSLRSFLTWNLLPMFENIEDIKAGKLRVGWDMSNVVALQENETERHARAREAFRVGGWTLNEFRLATGQQKDKNGDYYVRISSQAPVTPDAAGEQSGLGLTSQLFTTPQVIEDQTNISEGAEDSEAPEETEESEKSKDVPEKKTFEFDGIRLSREPNDLEKAIDLKGMVESFEGERDKISKTLTTFKQSLIEEATAELAKLTPENAFALTLTPNPKALKQVRKALESAYGRGREQVIDDLTRQANNKKNYELRITNYEFNEIELKAETESDEERLNTLADNTVSRIINEIQSRAINLFAAAVTLKIAAESLSAWLKERLVEQSNSFVERIAGITANAAINAGRDAEIENQSDKWKYVEYSAILDRNLCDQCKAADGKRAQDVKDLAPAPNPKCLGGDLCRCFHVAVYD